LRSLIIELYANDVERAGENARLFKLSQKEENPENEIEERENKNQV